ncbi:hypothetical protein LPB86_17615 [Pedobacter sp. MC2016-14]|uniref:hypothetical protein n=1 Tax=Pedobacter sp. MC2016-14 TaxID=2897327 RepID=UPI001E2F418D|nr:hypothetical protein [Pedobacter sp. MC2016-14]MCD0490063.1 hypothetical protein [Pedobacter sp. MC2016-14]
MRLTINTLNSCFTIFLLAALTGCNENSTSKKPAVKADSVASVAVTPTLATAQKYPDVETWIDDFKNFRNAVNDDDVAKLKTYFAFPLDSDSSQLWSPSKDVDLRKPHSEPRVYTEQDFEQSRSALFHPEFIKGLLKIKSAKLYESGQAESPEFNAKNEKYTLYASFDKDRQILSLNMAYFNNTDKFGEHISEGEHNEIYEFEVIDHKFLRFKRLVYAG